MKINEWCEPNDAITWVANCKLPYFDLIRPHGTLIMPKDENESLGMSDIEP